MALYPPENLQAPHRPAGVGGGLCESKAAIEKGRAFPFGGGPAAFALQNKNKKTTASIEAVVYGGAALSKSELSADLISSSEIVCVPC